MIRPGCAGQKEKGTTVGEGQIRRMTEIQPGRQDREYHITRPSKEQQRVGMEAARGQRKRDNVEQSTVKPRL